MTIFDDLVRETDQEHGRAQVGFWDAIWANSPAAIGDTGYVIIPDFAPDLNFGPVVWKPNFDIQTISTLSGSVIVCIPVFPLQGNPALIAFSETELIYVLQWSAS